MNKLEVFTTRRMPAEFRHILWNIKGFQPAYIFYRFLQTQKRILILGETSGRDSHFLASYGKEVYAVDIAVSPYKIDRLVIANITQTLPFPDKYFDGVLASEILEHVIDDVAALKEIRRVLADDGTLAISVPFISEWPGIHLRLHSASTISALIQYSGFTIEETYHRSAWLQKLHYVIQFLCTVSFHTARILRFVSDRDEIYLPILKTITDFDFTHWQGINPNDLGFHHGTYIKARKGMPLNLINLQVEVFSKVSTK